MQNSRNNLDRRNCNKEKCKSCIFRTDGKAIQLSPQRKEEILSYIAKGESSHICHTTNKTGYGALEYQAEIFSRVGLIPENSVDSLLDTAKELLGFD